MCHRRKRAIAMIGGGEEPAKDAEEEWPGR